MSTLEFGNEIQLHQPVLRAYALQLTKDNDEANDLVQETFLKALKYKNKFKQGTNIKGWLYTIMRNSFINNYRRLTKRRSFMDTQEEQYIMDNHTEYTAVNDASLKFIREDIDAAVKALPADLKQTFEMNALGYKYHEIAEELDIPIGTVKTRIFVARRKLREQLAEYATHFGLTAS